MLTLPVRSSRRALTTVLAASAVVAATAATVPTASAAARPVAQPDVAAAIPTADFTAGSYVVVLRDRPAATYDGGVAGLRATVGAQRTFAVHSAATTAYVDYLRGRQRDVAASVGVQPLATYALTTDGFGAQLTAGQAARLAADPRVAQVVPDEKLHIQDANTSTGYLGLEGTGGVWDSIGGVANAGRGIVIGVVDTGIAPENPSFAGAPLGTTAGAAPYLDGSTIRFHKSDGGDFTGVCQTGVQFTAAACSTKIVGARYFVDGFGADHIGTPATGEYLSPRDGEGHGSHTTSTAAGDAGVAAAGATIDGVTPAAKVAMYKACWSGPDPTSQDDDGCATVDLLSAIDAAVGDGVDVINYSIGGGAATTTDSLTDQAFMAAASAGIFVAAAGGNAGPDSYTVDNAAPWITTAAASTIPAPEATVELGDGTKDLGASVTVPAGGVTGPLVYAGDVGATGVADPELCGAGGLDAAKVTGAIVLCDRGTYDRVAKSAEVKRAGGIGMVLVNPEANSTDLDAHSVPTVHLDAQYSASIHAYAATPGATAALEPGNTSGTASAPVPQVAGFSSRGPVDADGSDLIKPDVAAPGVDILAATGNAAGGAPTFGYLSGTSMASPHIAGLGALYLSTDPTATPAEIKSAIMTTATDTVDADGHPVPDPFAQGNGEVRPTSYLDPGLVYLNDVDDWDAYLAGIGETPAGAAPVTPVDGSDLNLPSIGVGGLAGRQTVTRTVTSTGPGSYTASVSGLPGVTATVEPSTLDFTAAGQSQTFTVTFTRTDAPLGDFVTGYLDWSGAGHHVRSALAVRPVALDAPTEVAGTGTTGSVDVVPSVGEDADLTVAADGLAHGQVAEGSGTTTGGDDRYRLVVPDGATFLRVSLDAADDTADLDLTVYRRTVSGSLTEVGESATGSADEQVDVDLFAAGTYVVDVAFYAAGDAGPQLDYTLTSYVVDPSAGDGTFTATPDAFAGHVGETPTVTASWSGLEPGAYLGLVRFEDPDGNSVRTVVTVDAGDDVPVPPGRPTLTLDTGGTGFVGRGKDLGVTGAGLTPGATYAVAIDGNAPIRTGRATAQGTIDWVVTIPDAAATGDHVLHLTGPGAAVDASFAVTPVTVVDGFGFPSIAFDGTPRARISVTYSGHGPLRLTIASATTGTVFLDEVQHVPEVTGLPTFSIDSSTVDVAEGTLVATATPVLDDGSYGPTYTLDPFDAYASAPGSVTLTPTAGDPDVLDVDIQNSSGTDYYPSVRYYGCDGRRVYATGYLKDGESHQQLDLTGFTSFEMLDDDGSVIASRVNRAAGRCDENGIDVAQNYYATFTPTPKADPAYDPARPISMEMSYRYAAHSPGFELLIGEGVRLSQDPFFYEAIATDEVDTPGPIVTRTVSVPERTLLWAQTYYEAFIDPPGIQILGAAFLDVPELTVPALSRPVVRAATPKVAGAAVVGHRLTAAPGSWGPAGVRLGYQWLRDGRPVRGATSTSYRPKAADGGHRLAVRVTGTLDGAADVVRTSPGRTVLKALTATPRPRATGAATVGHTLTAVTGAWRPGAVAFRYQWLRDGKPVPGAHGRTYPLKVADRGAKVAVAVTGHRAGYEAVTRTSAARRVRP